MCNVCMGAGAWVLFFDDDLSCVRLPIPDERPNQISYVVPDSEYVSEVHEGECGHRIRHVYISTVTNKGEVLQPMSAFGLRRMVVGARITLTCGPLPTCTEGR